MKLVKTSFKFAVLFSVFLIPLTLIAASVNDLMGLGMSAQLANYISTYLINVDSSGSLVLPVATGEKLSVTVGGTEELSVNATAVTLPSSALTVTAGNITATSGEFIASTSGKTLALQEATAAATCMGTLTANGATPVVTSTTCATTGSRVFLTRTSAETGVVTAWISAISNGVSFSITGEAGDTGTYNWIIFHEAA